MRKRINLDLSSKLGIRYLLGKSYPPDYLSNNLPYELYRILSQLTFHLSSRSYL